MRLREGKGREVKVLVTFAVPAEFAPWRARHKFRRIPNKLLSEYRGRVFDRDVTVLLTGVGGNFAAARVRLLMQISPASPKFDFCVSSGLAGSLRAQHLLSDILVAHEIQAETVHHPWRVSPEISSDPELAILAADCGAKVAGMFFTSSRIVQTANDKSNLGVIADAVEMESFDILVEAKGWGIRAVAIRAIGDSVTENLPLDFSKTLTKLGEVSLGRVAKEVALQPGQLPALVRFGKQSRRAAVALADFLDRYVNALDSIGLPREPRSEVAAV